MAACSMCVGQHFQPQLGSIHNLSSLEPQGPCADLGEGSALRPNGAQQRGFGFSPRASRIKISAVNVGCMALPRQHRSSHHLPSTAMGAQGERSCRGTEAHRDGPNTGSALDLGLST